jgi:hypothetical protein
MIVGVTGSQHGITVEQSDWLFVRLKELGATELHHGDCRGADAVAHYAARARGLRVVIHPPINPTKRAFCTGDVMLEPLEYLERNRAIVEACEVLLATPHGPERLRSGTWSTVRYARTIGKPVEVMLP